MIVGDDLRKNPKVTGKPGCLWWLGVLSSGGWIPGRSGEPAGDVLRGLLARPIRSKQRNLGRGGSAGKEKAVTLF